MTEIIVSAHLLGMARSPEHSNVTISARSWDLSSKPKMLGANKRRISYDLD